MRVRSAFGACVLTASLILTGCNGSSTSTTPSAGGAAPTPVPTATPVPTPPPAPSASGTLTTSTTSTKALGLGPVGGGYNGTTTASASNVVSVLSITFSTTQPAGTPAVQSVRRLPQNVGGANIAPFGYFSITPSVTVTLPSPPGFTVQFPGGATVPPPQLSFIALYDPTNAAAGWNTEEGPATLLTPLTLVWTGPNLPFTMTGGQTYVFVAFSNGSSLPTPTPIPTTVPTPVPTPTPQPLTLSASTLSFTTAGAVQTFSATEAGYGGTLSATSAGASSCTGIATFAPASGAGPSATFTVTSVAAGQCQVNVGDTNGQSASVTVFVTTTSGTISGKVRQQP